MRNRVYTPCIQYLFIISLSLFYITYLEFGWALVIPTTKDDVKEGGGEPVGSHAESFANAFATGNHSSIVETNSWSEVNNHGGLQVYTITSNGTEIGYQVLGMTNCSQESYAYAAGSETAGAIVSGLCNSSVILDQPVSNLGVTTV